MAEGEGPLRLDELEVLQIVPASQELVVAVASGLSRRIALPCRLAVDAPVVEVPHIPGRNQADADRLLGRLEALDGAPGRVVIGLTDEDIGHPIFTHFFGRARHYGRAVLVSAARLRPSFYGLPEDPVLTVRRVLLEVLHELGHIAGLGHCEDWGCLMRFSSNVEGIDNRGTTYCAVCSAGLPPAFARVATGPVSGESTS